MKSLINVEVTCQGMLPIEHTYLAHVTVYNFHRYFKICYLYDLFMLMPQEDTEGGVARRVAEWEHYIRPKLKVARDRGHFDIHKTGTEILKSFPQNSARVTLQFEQFAADKPMADIPRYFLASLELVSIGP